MSGGTVGSLEEGVSGGTAGSMEEGAPKETLFDLVHTGEETFSHCVVGIVGSLSKNKRCKSDNKGFQDGFYICLWFYFFWCSQPFRILLTDFCF